MSRTVARSIRPAAQGMGALGVTQEVRLDRDLGDAGEPGGAGKSAGTATHRPAGMPTKIPALRKAGMSKSEIARRLCICRTSVRRLLGPCVNCFPFLEVTPIIVDSNVSKCNDSFLPLISF
jgi:hypothetical protein